MKKTPDSKNSADAYISDIGNVITNINAAKEFADFLSTPFKYITQIFFNFAIPTVSCLIGKEEKKITEDHRYCVFPPLPLPIR